MEDDEIGFGERLRQKVGYCSTPLHSRFKKGQSGNPSGRPKSRPTLRDDLAAELKENIQITESGRTKRISKQRAIIKSLFAKAIKGDGRSTGLLLGLCARLIASDPDQSAEALSAAELKILEDHLEREVQRRQLRSPVQPR